MRFSRLEYWSGLPFPYPGDLPNPETEPRSLALQANSLLPEPPGKTLNKVHVFRKKCVECSYVSVQHQNREVIDRILNRQVVSFYPSREEGLEEK